MNQEDRHLIRLFYQSIPTPGEKEAFEAVMNGTENQKRAYIATLVGKANGLDEATINAILAATTLTKEDRVMIFSGIIRQWLFSVLGF